MIELFVILKGRPKLKLYISHIPFKTPHETHNKRFVNISF